MLQTEPDDAGTDQAGEIHILQADAVLMRSCVKDDLLIQSEQPFHINQETVKIAKGM